MIMEGDFYKKAREKRKGCVWVCRTVDGRKLGVLVCGEQPDERKGGARRKAVRLGERSEFSVKKEAIFA